MAFHIKKPETDALARKVAKAKGVGLTEAVHEALARELAHELAKPAKADLAVPDNATLLPLGSGQSLMTLA